MTHEVYVARMNGEVVYVGEGRRGRHQHLTSGTSAVYMANLMHFLERDLDIEVTCMEDKESAQALESELINELRPLWNIFGTQADENKRFLKKSMRRHRERMRFPVEDQHFTVKYLCYAERNLLADNSIHIFDRFSKAWKFHRSNHYAKRASSSGKGVSIEWVGIGEHRVYFDDFLFTPEGLNLTMARDLR